YDVVLEPGDGIETIDGALRVSPFRFSFQTRADGETSVCDAYPASVGEPLPPVQAPVDPDAGGSSPVTRDSTGCAAGGSGGASALFALSLLIVSLHRRRKSWA